MIFEVTELPESPMRFFTPDLFLRVNSSNEEIADSAQEAWEFATHSYQHHLKTVLRSAPRNIVELAGACFHDAVIVGLTFDPYGRDPFQYSSGGRIPPSVPRPSPATFKLALAGRSIALVYLVWDGVTTTPPNPGWSEHKGPLLWLYDEIDEIWSRFGMFIHRILVSNGQVWEIPFYDVVCVEASTVPDSKPIPREVDDPRLGSRG